MMKARRCCIILLGIFLCVSCAYKDNDKGKFPAVAKFIIDDGKFDEAVFALMEVFDKEEYFVEDISEDREYIQPLITLPESVTAGVRNIIKQEDYYYLLKEVDQTTLAIYRYSAESGETEALVLPGENGVYPIYMLVDKNQLFWLESDCDYSQQDPAWNLMVMNLDSRIVKEIDSGKYYDGKSSLLPTMTVSDGTLAYLVGVVNDTGLYHYVKTYIDGNTSLCFSVENVVAPQVSPGLQGDILTFPEYYEDGWHLLIYNIKSGELEREAMPFFTEYEYPFTWSMVGEQIVYRSGIEGLYVTDCATGEYKLISNAGGGADKYAVLGSEYIYRDNGSIWIYDSETGTKRLLFRRDDFRANGLIYKTDGKVNIIMRDDNKWCILEYDGEE